MATVKAGMTFTHDRIVDPDWTPGPGQKWADAPRARMVVTRVAKGSVFFSYADGSNRWVMPRGVFTDRYGDRLEA
jgi:hypothetical protein